MNILKSRSNSNHPDTILLVVAGLILLFGLIMLSSASVAVGLSRFGDGGIFIKRQLVALVVGLVAGYYCYRMDYHKWQNRSFIFFIASLILLLLVFFPLIGAGEKGAQRWLDFYWVRFQPSELVKLSLVLYLSAWFSERGHKVVQDFKTGLVPFVGLMLVLFALVIKQPDLGTLLVIIWIGMALYFIGGAHIKHFSALIITGVVLVGIAIKAAPYRLARITAFLNPSLDPQGTGYHITQALIAIGSGGWLGVGLGHSRQKFLYLPEVTGDS
ncbi:MAG: FtsW/RodA/SpoVE family cell cycle protein, partial [Candidatus Komeilibacteria bacterium]|nr:FtsW/RodA/SpoVE family cell cycle protein [Candidatus Komeilibacteria bacterium]